MPRSTNPAFIQWASSKSKQILMDDLENGVIPLEEDVITAEIAWDTIYRHAEEFIEERVVFEQFKPALKRHRKAVAKKQRHLRAQMSALEHDTQFMHHDAFNKRGVKIFHGTHAHALLKEDIAEEKHIEMGVAGLYWWREEYWNDNDKWDLTFFKRRVRQEICLQKFNYYMDVKRANKAKKDAAKAAREAKKHVEENDYYDIYQEEDEDEIDDNDD